MTIEQAKQTGGRQLLKTAVVLFVLIEMVFLVIEINGDVANGILFYLQYQTNWYTFLFLVLSFITLYILGRQTGVALIIKKENRWKISFIYSFVATALLWTYLFCWDYMGHIIRTYKTSSVNSRFSVEAAILIFSTLFIVLTIAWTWACNAIRAKMK